jgi:hypothetical protein
MTSVSNENEILIPRITFKETLRSGHTLLSPQFPLPPAYATIFHSCQGLTSEIIGINLSEPAFTHGQLHTALQNSRTDQCMYIDKKRQQTNPKCKVQRITY